MSCTSSLRSSIAAIASWTTTCASIWGPGTGSISSTVEPGCGGSEMGFARHQRGGGAGGNQSGRARYRKLAAVGLALLMITGTVMGASMMEGIVFSHRFHVEDIGIACQECHPEATEEGTSVEDRLPKRASCGTCHDVEDQSNCRLCHASEDASPRCATVQACEIFSHAAHARLRPECSTCHEGIACAESSEEAFLPPATICGECHMADAITPQSHSLAWEHRHGRAAELEEQNCTTCHHDRVVCRECHAGDNLSAEGTPHPLSYLYNHGADARIERTRCSTCHRDELFCIECHAAYGTKPLSHDHAAWASGGEHGREARRSLGQCMACHDETAAAQSCGGCHP
ncbi:MAG: hypothetical protein GF330_00390 [Candidatus Eisenbacteria bacterium]|nr:hypothetical protein [Candidatus Eisenbacteria bacterium]